VDDANAKETHYLSSILAVGKMIQRATCKKCKMYSKKQKMSVENSRLTGQAQNRNHQLT